MKKTGLFGPLALAISASLAVSAHTFAQQPAPPPAAPAQQAEILLCPLRDARPLGAVNK